MKIILVGKAASGKDFLKSKMERKGFRTGVSHTTRPARPGEVDGVDYHFIDDVKFIEMIGQEEFIEYMEFNGWFYGQTEEDFNASDIMIMSKDGLDMLPKVYRDQCIVIYLDVPMAERLKRLSSRDDKNDSIERRITTDEKQFHGFTDYEIRITNPDF
jgi:guanylate kinase